MELCNQYCMKAVLLLLLAVGTAAAPHVNFLQFSQNGKPSGVRSAIGYPIEVLEFAWRKYGSRLIRAVHRYPGFTVVARSRDRLKLGKRVAESLYNGLYWIHHYPTIAGAAWPTKRRYTRKMFYDCVMPVVLHLSQLVDEIHYSDRLHPLNHYGGFFSKYFTTIVDCAPVLIKDSSDAFWRDSIYQHKYGSCCFKIQLGINFLGCW